MNDTNPKIDDVAKAFAALPQNGRNIHFTGKVKSNFDPNTHIQGLAPYRTFHLLTHSDFGERTGRLLVLDRTPGREALVGEPVPLPVMSDTKPFFFHAGGCQVIGDCLVVPIENGERKSFIVFMDVSDPAKIKEVNPAVRIERKFNDAGSVGITNATFGGKDFWVLCAYDNGATDVYVSEDAFPGTFKEAFKAQLSQSELQSLSLVTDVSDNVFAIGLHRTFAGKDMAVLYAVDLAKERVTVVSQRHFRTTGPDDPSIGGGAHFRWGAGIEIVSATELALFCSERKYDSGCNINVFDSSVRSVRAVAPRRAAGSAKPRRGRKAARRPK